MRFGGKAVALKKNTTGVQEEESTSTQRTKALFSKEHVSKRENKVLTTFSIEPSFKQELEDLFDDLGLGWAAGIRFALKEFFKRYNDKK